MKKSIIICISTSLGLVVAISNGCSDQRFASIDSSIVSKIGGPAGSSNPTTHAPDPIFIDEIQTPEDVATAVRDFSCLTIQCSESDNESKKVVVCHVPPRNPENRHEICVSVNALKAHIGESPGHHGSDDADRDHLGFCQTGDGNTNSGDTDHNNTNDEES